MHLAKDKAYIFLEFIEILIKNKKNKDWIQKFIRVYFIGKIFKKE